MKFLKFIILWLPIILFFEACTMAEKPGALDSGFPIQHFDIQNGATKPMEFNRVQTAYLSNANSTNKFELRYYPIDDIVEFEDGWLVSGAKGEWGGILYWMGLDGDIDILIKNSDNPSDVALLNDAVYITWSPFLPVTTGHSDLIRIRNPKAGEIEVESFAVPGGVTGFKYEAGDLWVKASTWDLEGVQAKSYEVDNIVNQTKLE